MRRATGSSSADARMKAIDLQYHDLRPERGLARRAGLATLVTPERGVVGRDATRRRPPGPTSAGAASPSTPTSVVAANWDSMVFDAGREPLSRVPMMEPLRGTAEHVARLIDESPTARELLDRLGS